ncbi:MAG: hypothetical protein N4A40_10595 [Tissierellales bacterium]|nr:hypothetical protein [Tissierellales bacterium]
MMRTVLAPDVVMINFEFESIKKEIKSIFNKAYLVTESCDYVSFVDNNSNYNIDIDDFGKIDCFSISSDYFPSKEVEQVKNIFKEKFAIKYNRCIQVNV